MEPATSRELATLCNAAVKVREEEGEGNVCLYVYHYGFRCAVKCVCAVEYEPQFRELAALCNAAVKVRRRRRSGNLCACVCYSRAAPLCTLPRGRLAATEPATSRELAAL